MKNIIKLVFAIAAIALCSTVSAQTLKLAHINMDELIVSMPEYEMASVELQGIARNLEEEIELMTVEFNRRLEDFQRNGENFTEIVRQSRQQELVSLQQRIQSFQEGAQEQMQIDQHRLMQPIIEKATKAIEDVAKEQGITYVFTDQAIIFKAVGTLDLLPSVKQHLGIRN